MKKAKEIFVFADWAGLKAATLVGKLHAEVHRGHEVFSFEYDASWLSESYSQSLDPSLQLYAGRQYLPEGKKNFGVFLDSSPDRWGRTLMERREQQLARSERRSPQTLLESDFLLGVFDGHRMGALRFRVDLAGPFLDNNKEMASPPWTSLRDLQRASEQLENESASDAEISKAVRLLIAPGSSLGGARPKSSVVDEKGGLWIAKFPSAKDRVDVGAWEMLVHELAGDSGIEVADAKLEKLSGDCHTFLSKRFDRTDKQERLHFVSAMTLVDRSDGDNFEKGASYIELATFLATGGSQADADLRQLWRRILFSVCVSNTDDHLRNHGFIFETKGWRLSPAYDINPNADGDGLSLNISETDNAQDLDLLREVAPSYRMKPKEVEAAIKEVCGVVSGWRSRASKLGISRQEQERMSRAFRLGS